METKTTKIMALWKVTDADVRVVGFYDAATAAEAIEAYRKEAGLTDWDEDFDCFDAFEATDAEMAAYV